MFAAVGEGKQHGSCLNKWKMFVAQWPRNGDFSSLLRVQTGSGVKKVGRKASDPTSS